MGPVPDYMLWLTAWCFPGTPNSGNGCISASLTLLPALGTFFLLLGCPVHPPYESFCLIVSCSVLLSLGGMLLPRCLRLALPSVLIGETPPRRGRRAPPRQPRPPATLRSAAAPAQSPEPAREVGGSGCGRRVPGHLLPPLPRADRSRERTHPSSCAPRRAGPSGTRRSEQTPVPPSPQNPGRCSPWESSRRRSK